jgi:hypothetical protein
VQINKNQLQEKKNRTTPENAGMNLMATDLSTRCHWHFFIFSFFPLKEMPLAFLDSLIASIATAACNGGNTDHLIAVDSRRALSALRKRRRLVQRGWRCSAGWGTGKGNGESKSEMASLIRKLMVEGAYDQLLPAG